MDKQKILIIEDEIIIALNIKSILEMKGYEVCDIGISADDSVKLTEKHNPDLIIMDIIIDGEKDGIFAVEEIKKKHDIPVIYLTANFNEKLVKRAKKTEPYGYIIKPISQEELLITVEIALYKHDMERKIRKTELEYRKLFNMLNGFAYCKMLYDEENRPIDWIYIDINKTFEKITGLSRKDVINNKITEVIPGFRSNAPELFDYCSNVALTGEEKSFEIYLDHFKKWFSINAYCPEKGYFVAVYEDITERKKAEETIKASLKEKEILLREIHHRVKNNMQVISSLISLQSSQLDDEKAREPFKICENRIHSMTLVHEQLYHSKELASINFNEYIQKLINMIFVSNNISRDKIKPILNIKDINLGLDKAIPCGLIITELITNTLKHAFPKGKMGEIKLDLKKDKTGSYSLIVNDNGIGIPEDVSIKNTKSLGFTLLNTLVKQLNGEIEVTGKKGTKVTITFPGE